MVLLLEPAWLADAAGVPSTLLLGLFALPLAEGTAFPLVCFILSRLPEATTASMSRNASADSTSAITASTTATGADAARRVPSQLAFSTCTATQTARSTLLACGSTAAPSRSEQISRRLASGMHASSSERASRASTSIAITSSMTLSTRLPAVTSYLSVFATIELPLGVACSSRRVTVPSTPDLTPYSTYTITCSESEYLELCTV
mmetsp:Transcript_28336/g.67417  ORF Transcript_28336/g.67417 Transcript_28336/m.67417 type:complete len:205 (+) Transcript_28336:793-1407(+)